MENINTKAFAKVNLAIDVLGKLDNGYHSVRMVMQSISLYDDISVRIKSGNGLITAETNRTYIPSGMKNLACKAADVFLSAAGLAGYDVVMSIKKRIPVCAGMGGGSSDAAAVLIALNDAFNVGMGEETLCDLANKVGSDVSFCLFGGTAVAQGRGEILTQTHPLPDCYFVICKPDFSVSTPVLFSKIDGHRIKRRPDIDGILAALEASDIKGVAQRCYNVFEDVLPARERRIVENIKGVMLSEGALGACMTGTGSAVYGIFSSQDQAQSAVSALKGDYSQVFLASNIGKTN